MFAIIGLVLMNVIVLMGFMMEGGNPAVLIQPIEMLLIFGVTIGAFLIANPMPVIMNVVSSVPTIFTAKSPDKKDFMELLLLLYSIFNKVRKDGPLSLEPEIEDPHKSELFKKYKGILANHHLIDFLCDNLRVMLTAKIAPHEFEGMADLEIETHHHQALTAAHGVNRVADGMPGLGLVAAVLGIVLTMGKIDQPPTVIGHSVAVALVGTFLGIFFCYGIFGPMATNLEQAADANTVYFQVTKVALMGFMSGYTPAITIEFARRAIPGYAKPTFFELEKARKGG